MGCDLDDNDKSKCFCVIGGLAMIACIVLLAAGTGEIRESNHFTEATKEECTISHYRQIPCRYNCGGKNDFCDGNELHYYAISSKCGDNAELLNNDFDCASWNYDNNDYYINETFTCYILPCNDAQFTFTNYEENKTVWIILTVIGGLCGIVTILFCVCGIRLIIKDISSDDDDE